LFFQVGQNLISFRFPIRVSRRNCVHNRLALHLLHEDGERHLAIAEFTIAQVLEEDCNLLSCGVVLIALDNLEEFGELDLT